MKRMIILGASILLVLNLSSCSGYIHSGTEFYGGDMIDPEKLSELAESIFAEEKSSEREDDEKKTSTGEEKTERREHDGIYYWTDGGTKYHKWSDCAYLVGANTVYEGTLVEAQVEKSGGLCDACAKK